MYVYGVTHIPRLEDWSTMPVEHIGLMLMVSFSLDSQLITIYCSLNIFLVTLFFSKFRMQQIITISEHKHLCHPDLLGSIDLYLSLMPIHHFQ